jgi:imidazolonepropionase-like amidohydrolase
MNSDNAHRPDPWLAVVGGRLIDGTGQAPLPDAVVLIRGAVIHAVGRREAVEIPPEAQTLEVAGQTILPGLFDCHCHISMTTLSVEKRLFTPKTVEVFQTAEMLKRTLHAGFTTIREAGLMNDVGFRQAVEMGLIEGPRLVLAGGLGQTGGPFDEYYPHDVELPFYGVEVGDGVPEVQKAARKVLRKGFDLIKVCASGAIASPTDSPNDVTWTLAELQAIVHEASARGKVVAAHAEGTEGIKLALRAGVWSVEHGSLLDDEAIGLFLDTGAYLVPTLFVMEEILERGEAMGLAPAYLAKMAHIKNFHLASFRKAAQAGVKIAVGTDAIDEKMHGRNARELELMVQNGYTPMQAIVAATKTAAEVCRIADKVGTLTPGKLADLLVVDGDPLDHIDLLQDGRRLSVVMKEGQCYVNRLGTSAAPRPYSPLLRDSL